MKLFKWTQGRQSSTQYEKWCFLYWRFFNTGLDGYILRYKANQQLPIHKDIVENGIHYRLNIKLKGKCKFWCPSILWKWGERIVLFRPDLFFHSLTTKTKVLKLSLGLVIFKHKSHGS